MTLLRLHPRFRYALRHGRDIEAREQWSRSEIEAYQLLRINRMWERARTDVPFYRHLALDLPTSFESLDEYRQSMPILGKRLVQSRASEIRSETVDNALWMATSGSTGAPLQMPWESRGFAEMLAATKYRQPQMWGVGVLHRSALLWGTAPKGGVIGTRRTGRTRSNLSDRTRQHLVDRARRRLRLSVQFDQDDLRRHLESIRRFKPRMLYGISNGLRLLAQEAERLGIRPQGLKVVIMSGETTMPGTVEIVERAFGVPAVEEYGSAEGGVMAIEFPDRVLRAREDIALIETVPTGNSDGMYEIVVTPFTNPAFPLFRYRTGDITHRPLDTSVEGFAHLERILGREDDFLRTATGAWVHPIDVYRLFAGPYQSTVRMFRVRQGRKGDLTVWVEGRPHMQVDYDGIRDLLGHMVGGWPVRVLPVKRMPTNPTGKQRPIASEMTESTAVTR